MVAQIDHSADSQITIEAYITEGNAENVEGVASIMENTKCLQNLG